MKIKAYKTVDLEVDVSVDVSQITAALYERLEEAEEATPGGPVTDSSLCVFFNDVAKCLKAVDDKMLERLTKGHRAVVVEFLTEQAARIDGARPTDAPN